MSTKAEKKEKNVVVSDSNKAEFDDLLPGIRNQETGSVKVYGTLPVFLSDEGEKFYIRIAGDRDVLIRHGLPENSFDLLKKGPGALRYAQAELERALLYHCKWKTESHEAYALRDQLKHDFLFACRNDSELQKRINGMTKGVSRRAMVQHLQNLSTFGGTIREQLEKINFDFTRLDKAAELSARMGNLLGASGNETSEARVIRDKAYVLLKNVMTEIREYGRHAFFRDRVHAAEYNVSTYRKTVTRRKKEDAEKTEPVDVPLNAAA